MNHLAELVFKVPGKHTKDVIHEVAIACGISQSAIRLAMNDPSRDMKATVAVNAIRYFNSYFPCSIEDLIETDLQRLAKKRGLIKADLGVKSPIRKRGSRRTVNS